MCLAGSKHTIIAETLGVPKSSVNDIWQRFLKRGTSENAPRPGRPSITTKRDERQLVNIIKKDRRASLADITNKWNANVSISTTRRVPHELELNSRKARKKQFLNDRNIAQRLAWALERKNWSLEEWKREIWTDEASFELGEKFEKFEFGEKAMKYGMLIV
jgi:transposase